ncbi:MAG TPA: CHAT domain-containing protein [Candidatus Angelobacter sp.]|nr:CHAT domain-containing protein [Candidatus Angelobacter sp.]
MTVRRALNNLALALLRNQGDKWLTVFISEPLSPKGDGHLKTAIALNYSGDPNQAEREAHLAKKAFESAGNQAGALRADLEIVYALRRQSKSIACQAEIAGARKRLSHARFVWLDLQLRIEESVCAGMHNDFGLSASLAAAVLRRSQSAHYPALQLRAQALFASWHTLEDRFELSWLANEAGLKLFWEGPYPAERAFQFYSDLETAAERSGRWHLATLLQREALALLSETERVDFLALAHFRLATDLMHSNNTQDAQSELAIANDLFKKLAPKPRRLFLAYGQLEMAKLEIHRGALQNAVQILTSIRSEYQGSNNFNIDIPLERTSAEFDQASANPKNERRHLVTVIGIISQGLRSLKSPQQRWDWQREEESAYRRLLELDLEENVAASTALRHWRAYESAGTGIVKTGPQYLRLSRRFRKGTDRATIVVAVLNHQLAVWVVARNQVNRHLIKIDASEVENLARQFHFLCSDPTSSFQKVNEAGSRLYQLMIKPVEPEISGIRDVRIEADDHLGLLPWTALVSDRGVYFSEEHTITLSAGPDAVETLLPTIETRALFVYPGAVRVDGLQYNALLNAEEELQYLSTLYPRSQTILGKTATRTELVRSLPGFSLFHFAGHAITRNGGGELILYGSSREDFLSASSLSQISLGKMDLAFLAACSSAEVEGSAAKNPYGLVWSFLNSGAAHVVASQWAVDSSATSSFTRAFYREYRNTRDVAVAVNSAARVMRADPLSSHPFYWAAFQAFGH